MGVGTFAESDVYAGARVFTGWNLARPGAGAAQHFEFSYNAGAARHRREGVHLPDLSRTAAGSSRRAPPAAGMQDGLDLINAVARHPADGAAAGAQAVQRSSSTKWIRPTRR